MRQSKVWDNDNDDGDNNNNNNNVECKKEQVKAMDREKEVNKKK